jgi:hypothetical protein
LEATLLVRAVAKRLVLGLSAPAQGVGFFSGVERILVAEMIHHLDGGLDYKGPILATAYDNWIGHRPALLKQGNTTLIKA